MNKEKMMTPKGSALGLAILGLVSNASQGEGIGVVDLAAAFTSVIMSVDTAEDGQLAPIVIAMVTHVRENSDAINAEILTSQMPSREDTIN